MDTMIGGQLIGFDYEKNGSKAFNAFDPVKGEELSPTFTDATIEEVNAAVEKAYNAFDTYKQQSGKKKAAFLEAITAEMEAAKTDIINAANAETALPLARLQGEFGRTTSQLKLFARLLENGSWVNARIDEAVIKDGVKASPDLRQMQVPVGPVGVFGASNFPLAFSVAGGDTASALAAGCPVVYKAHPAHPHTSHLVGAAIQQAAKKTSMPDGVFSLVHGKSTEVGMALVNHEHISAIGFTGSFRGGKALYDAAVRRPKPIPVYAEMGSVNPVIIMNEALRENSEKLAEQLVQSVTLGVGQFCTNPGLFITIASPEADDFIDQLKQKIAAAQGGYMLTPGILKAYNAGVKKLTDEFKIDAIDAGQQAGSAQATPHLLTTSVQQVISQPDIMAEVFGPCSVHIRAASYDELLSFVKHMEGQLTATIHGTENDLKSAESLVAQLREKAGRLIINGFPTGVAVSPAMVHGGPYPATTPAAGTSVGTLAIYRFTRPLCYQDFPEYLLPDELKDDNPLKIWRMMNGKYPE